jgi:hypothetical protein
MSSSKLLIREALAPKSCDPTRDAERISIRVPWPIGVTRMTTSSRNPMIGVRATASITPSRRANVGERASPIVHLRLVTSASAAS